MRGAKLVVVLGVLAVGCKKKASSGGGGVVGAPTSTADADALWALAPEGATVGVVVSPRAVAMVEHAWLDVRSLLATAPELADINQTLGTALSRELGKPDVTLADVGLTPTKGGGLFVLPDGGAVVIVPVGDRDKFLTATHGTKGANGDTVGDATCKTLHGAYICASTPAQFDLIGKAKLKPRLDIVGTRGDIEVVARLPTPVGQLDIAGVVQLARGTLVARVAVAGIPEQVFTAIDKAQLETPGDLRNTAGFAVMTPRPFFEQAPPIPLVGGVTLRDLGRTVTGLFVHIAAGSTLAEIRMPLDDPKPAATVLEHCSDIPQLAALGATVSDGGCHIPVPSLGTELDAWIANNELRIGKKNETAPVVSVPMGTIGEELAKTPAAFAFWGRGTLFAPLAEMPKLPPMPREALIGIRALSLLDELGMSFRVDGGKGKGVFVLRTVWANPDDVTAKLLAITPQMVLDGKAAAAAKPIAEASPASPFAADYKAGIGGLMAPAAVFGVLSAVAVPAFMDYMNKSKHTEADLELNKLGKNAKVYYITNGAFPAGDAPLTPSEPCCQGPNAKCVSAASAWQNPVWTALDFQIDMPSLFQYRYHSDGKTIEAEAIGDLDCDGNAITYKLVVDAPNGTPTMQIERPAPNSD
jgi:hypothetical protein